MNEEMYEKLNKTESYHWWFKAKRKIVMKLAAPYFEVSGEKRLTLADMGCGTGLMLHELEKYGDVTGYDYSDTALEYCRKKTNAKLVKFDLGNAAFSPATQYDMVFALDIIEHIEDDKTAMDNIYKSVKHGGHAIITVPAFQWLWSQNDINNMHQRRYLLKQLSNLAKGSGFTVEYESYYNFWLFFPVAVIRFLTKIFKTDKHSAIEYGSGEGVLNDFLFKCFFSESIRISNHKAFPFGVSIIMLISKEK